MTRLILAALFLSTHSLAQSPARVDSLGWMTGDWVSETARGKVAETWLGPGNGLMVAVNLSTFAGGRKSFEFLRIAETPAGFSYFASPEGRPPTEFRLKEAGDKRVVFENAAHDFPQRILYWREGDALVARIEGTMRGEARHREWRFTRKP
jgi:hypothetical protein